MARSLNKVMLIGNLGADPEVRTTPSGTKLAKLSLATNRQWQNQAGEKQEKTEWHRLTAFGRLVDIIEQYCKKGDRLYVEGRVEYSSTGEGDDRRWFTDIVINEMVMLGSDGAGAQGASGGQGASRQQSAPSPSPAPAASPSLPEGDPLPF